MQPDPTQTLLGIDKGEGYDMQAPRAASLDPITLGLAFHEHRSVAARTSHLCLGPRTLRKEWHRRRAQGLKKRWGGSSGTSPMTQKNPTEPEPQRQTMVSEGARQCAQTGE